MRFFRRVFQPTPMGGAGCVIAMFVLSGISALAAWLVLLNGSPT